MSKENISAIIPANKFNNIEEVINSLIDLVAEIIIINSSNNNLNFNDFLGIIIIYAGVVLVAGGPFMWQLLGITVAFFFLQYVFVYRLFFH